MALLAVACLVALVSLASNATAAQPPVRLGTADSFAALAGSTVTNTGPSRVNGDLGVSPGTAVTGFPPGTVNGTTHAADAVAARAQVDVRTAYNDAAGRAPAVAVLADLGGRTLTPGVYKSGAALGLTGTLTLDARGDPDAVFVFQAGSTLTTAPGSRVNLINGAQPCNVSWQIGSSATLGTASAFSGNILASESISMNDAVTLNGRALARNGAVTLTNDTITAAHCAPGTIGGPTIPGGGMTGGDTRAPAPPVLISPRSHATVRAGNVRFRWRAAARAERYTLLVDHRRMNTGAQTRATMRVRPGSHSFRVIARNRYGARSSRHRSFRAKAAGSPDLCNVCHAEPQRPPSKKPSKGKGGRPNTRKPGRRTCQNPGRNPTGKYSYLVYEAKKGGGVVYVGITRNFRTRCGAHRRGKLGDLFGRGAGPKDGIVALSHLRFLSLLEARQVEQVLIEKYGFNRTHRNLNRNLDTRRIPSGAGQLRNGRNEISAAHKRGYCRAVDSGRLELIAAKYSSRAKNPFMRRRNCTF